MGLAGIIRDYLGLVSGTKVQLETGESMLLLFETFSFPLFFSHMRFIEELTLLKTSQAKLNSFMIMFFYFV